MAAKTSKNPNGVNGIYSQAGDVAPGSEAHRDLKVVNMRNPCTRKRNKIKIGTWNVRTMLRRGKLENIKQEMRKMEVNILGLSEVRWKEQGDFYSDGYRIIYSGGTESQRGVAVVLDNEISRKVITIDQRSDRLLVVKIKADPVDLVIVQVYMPTSDHEDEEIDAIYEELEEIMKAQKGNDNIVIMGDWNAVVGEGKDGREVGEFGLGNRNERGERLVEFSKHNKLMVTNTWFNQPKRRRYTWIKPGDTGRYQLDYILVRQRYSNSIKNAHSYPGADADSDHNLVAVNMEVRLKKLKSAKRRMTWNIEKLKNTGEAFKKNADARISIMRQDTVEQKWDKVKECCDRGC